MDKKEHAKDQPKKKKKEREKLPNGVVVRSEKGFYKIEGVLGSGGFGDVYKVSPVRSPERQYAMKTECIFKDKKKKTLNRLKVEMAVFSDILKCSSPIDKSHFVQMIDKGKTDAYKFIVMEIVSYSLIDIRSNMQNEFTSQSTIIQIGRQTMQSIEALHHIGYVHRDIKPHNFAVGRPPNDHKIFMLDFGIARKFLDAERRVRIPRKYVKFLGTVKYAARACHLEKEQCRRDDIEVWFYMMLEYFNKDNLRWRRLTDKDKIVKTKCDFMTKYKAIEPRLSVPNKFYHIFEIIESLTYTCTPDYSAIHKTLDDCCKEENIDETLPLDWIGKAMDPNKKKKKAKIDEKLHDEENTDDRNRYERREKKKREEDERRKKLEDDLIKLYKDIDENKTPEQIRAEIRSRMRKTREAEKQRRRERRDEEEEDDENSDDDYSDETYEPRRRSKMSSVRKAPNDEEPSRRKHESRKKRTGRHNSRDDGNDDERRQPGNRKKPSRHTQSSYGGSHMDKVESHRRRKKQSRMEKPIERPKEIQPDSPPLKRESVHMRTVNDYIVFGDANDLEKAEDAKDKESADKKAKEKNLQEITGKCTELQDKKDSSDKKGK